MLPFDSDYHSKSYQNPQASVALSWDRLGLNLGMQIKPEDEEMDLSNYFTSRFAMDIYGDELDRFHPTEFHFHYPSEHTVDGKRFDVEMHVSHTTDHSGDDSGIVGASVAIFFSTTDFDNDVTAEQNSTLNDFFYALGLDILEARESDFEAKAKQANFV